MKKFTSALIIIACVAGASITATALAHDMNPITEQGSGKTEITYSELPGEVKDVIMKGQYAKWDINKAYKITSSKNNNKLKYEIHFAEKKEKGNKVVVIYGSDGSVIK